MFVRRRTKNNSGQKLAATDKDTTFDTAVNQNQQPPALARQSAFIGSRLAGSRHEDDFAPLIPGPDAVNPSQVRIQLLNTQTEVGFGVTPESPSKSAHAKGILPQKAANSPPSPPGSKRRGLGCLGSADEDSQEFLDARKTKKVKTTESDDTVVSPQKIEDPMEDSIVPSLNSFYQPFHPIPGDLGQRAQISSEVPHSVERALRSEQQWRDSWRDLQMNSGREKLPPDWNPSPISFGESVTSPGTPTKAHYPTQLGDPGMRELSATREVVVYDDSDEDDGDGELECEFNLKAIKKKVKDAMKPLRRMQQQEDPASKKLQVGLIIVTS